MDEKINSQLIQEYSVSYASSIVENFFSDTDRIVGDEILGLCELPQINFFVIRELLKSWEQEIQKYKSPYFDYDSPPVKEALYHFRNTLSNHISITQDDFIPLLEKGVSSTLYLILSPYNFYSRTLHAYEHGQGKMKVSSLKDEIKYIKINKAPLEALVHQLEMQGLDSIVGSNAFLIFEQILEEMNFNPEDVGPYITQFNKVYPLEVSRLYELSGDLPTATSFRDKAAPLEASVRVNPATTVAENYQKITQLKDWLNINQRFMFTKVLFDGDFDLFNKSIARIDSMSSFDEAMQYLDSHYPQWNKTSEEYEEFIELLGNRFG